MDQPGEAEREVENFAEENDKDSIIVKMTNDEEFLKETKLVELFACKAENIQIFFTDFFNMTQTYNTPGTSGDKNWSLRLPNDFDTRETINFKKPLTNQGFLLIIKALYEKTMTKTVEYISKSQRVGDGVSLI